MNMNRWAFWASMVSAFLLLQGCGGHGSPTTGVVSHPTPERVIVRSARMETQSLRHAQLNWLESWTVDLRWRNGSTYTTPPAGYRAHFQVTPGGASWGIPQLIGSGSMVPGDYRYEVVVVHEDSGDRVWNEAGTFRMIRPGSP